MTSRFRTSRPGLSEDNRRSVRPRIPAATNSTTANAISDTTKPLCSRRELAATVRPRLGATNLLVVFADTYNLEPEPFVATLTAELPGVTIVGGGATEDGKIGETFQFCGDVVSSNSISAMLLAFPHLFPPSTNQWKPNVDRDPARDTYASPDVWTNFADFYKQATAASKSAFTASRAKNNADFIKAVASLRLGCNSCHSAYLKTD